MSNKVQNLSNIRSLVAELQRKGHTVVHCHGVFDLLHPGHIRHLKEAKASGDTLVVSITPDHFVNKGPGRPAFNETLRLEQLASLSCVDYVLLNDTPDAVSVIQKIRPDIYVKGEEYQKHADDVTGKISEESAAVEAHGGKVHYTQDIVFSSSKLINQFFDSDSQRISPFLKTLKESFSLSDVFKKIDSFSDMRVLIVGDAIIDEYQYVEPLGQSGKGVHLAALLREKEVFLGGSLVIANHLSSFVKSVSLLTGIGKRCPHAPTLEGQLADNVSPEWIPFDAFPTLTKTRFVLKDGNSLSKLFETYSSNEPLLNKEQSDQAISYLQEKGGDFDLVLVCDFGNGFTNPGIISTLCQLPNFLAVNTQTNSGNRGYNVITHYHRADYISLNEPELRLAAHDRECQLAEVVTDLGSILQSPLISVTRGVGGVELHTLDGNVYKIPALTMQAIDRVGAGDSYFALSALGAAKGYSPLLSGFLGSIAAAIDVQIVGNREAIDKVGVCKYLTRLMK